MNTKQIKVLSIWIGKLIIISIWIEISRQIIINYIHSDYVATIWKYLYQFFKISRTVGFNEKPLHYSIEREFGSIEKGLCGIILKISLSKKCIGKPQRNYVAMKVQEDIKISFRGNFKCIIISTCFHFLLLRRSLK